MDRSNLGGGAGAIRHVVPQARLDAFRQMMAANRQAAPGTYDDSQLHAWGITRQRLERVCQPPGEE